MSRFQSMGVLMQGIFILIFLYLYYYNKGHSNCSGNIEVHVATPTDISVDDLYISMFIKR